MGVLLDNIKNEVSLLLRNKKNLLSLLVLLILAVGLYGFITSRQTQIIKSRATSDPVVFSGPNVSQTSTGGWVTTKPQVALELTSPLGPPVDYPCTAGYSLIPAAPKPNVDLRVNITVDSPALTCGVLYLDNKAIPLSSCTGLGEQAVQCNSFKSGAVGNHVLQLKFGQAGSYPGVACEQVINCNPTVYRVDR